MSARPPHGSGPSSLTRAIPLLVIALTAVHFAVFVVASTTVGAVARDGFWNAVTGNPRREFEMWFFLAGFGLLALGTLSRRVVRDTGRLPAQLGWYLLATGVPLQILSPVSGAPGLIALGVLALIAARRDSAAARAGHIPPP
ncbi:DUF6463 family protein [Streptomyces sp. NPDC093600]|uniref:DUF6463 family protein n=1 Tax=Streptomyces sp. NPDC093600 TaxID=3366047 RepID=UPI00381A74F7